MPIIVDGHQEYEIERIINSNWLNNKHFQFKVTYKGYGKEHDEWQFRDDLLEDLGQDTLYELTKDFYHQNPLAKKFMDKVRAQTKPKTTIKKSSCLTPRCSRHLGGYCNETRPHH